MPRLILVVIFCLGFVARAGLASPNIEHWLAPSGARVFFVENHDLPMLDVQVDFAAGAAFDPPAKAGLAALTGTLLDLGLPDRDENAIANQLADLGAQLSGGVGMDRASWHLRTLSAEAQRLPATELFAAVLGQPQFPAEVLAREQARSVAALKEALTQPGVIASRAFWASLYPQHAYGRRPTSETVSVLQRADLLSFHRRHYPASQATVTLVGDLDRQQAEALAQAITSGLPPALSGSEAEKPIASTTQVLLPAREQVIAHSAAQSHLLIGLPAVKRGDPDMFALTVGNYILGGGGSTSRLMQAVREDRGLAYSVQSGFAPMQQTGPFQISLETHHSQARQALAVVREVLSGFLDSGPTEAELLAAKQYLVGSFPLGLDSNGKILAAVAAIGFYGMPLDYLDRYIDNVQRVTIDDIKAAFHRHVPMDHLVTIVVGGPGE